MIIKYFKDVYLTIVIFLFKKIFGNINVVLFVSTGRTGTKYFERYLNMLQIGLDVHHEPGPDLFEISVNKVRLDKSKNEIIYSLIKARIKYIILFLLYGKKTYVESNSNCWNLLKEWKILFKKLKVVFITRDYRTQVLSAYYKEPQADGRNNYYSIDDTRNRINAADLNEMTLFEWYELPRICRIAWLWNKCNFVISEQLNRYEIDYRMVKFEDIFSDNDNISKKKKLEIIKYVTAIERDFVIYSQFEKNIDKINASEYGNYKDYSDLPGEYQNCIEALTRYMSEKLSY